MVATPVGSSPPSSWVPPAFASRRVEMMVKGIGVTDAVWPATPLPQTTASTRSGSGVPTNFNNTVTTPNPSKTPPPPLLLLPVHVCAVVSSSPDRCARGSRRTWGACVFTTNWERCLRSGSRWLPDLRGLVRKGELALEKLFVPELKVLHRDLHVALLKAEADAPTTDGAKLRRNLLRQEIECSDRDVATHLQGRTDTTADDIALVDERSGSGMDRLERLLNKGRLAMRDLSVAMGPAYERDVVAGLLKACVRQEILVRDVFTTLDAFVATVVYCLVGCPMVVVLPPADPPHRPMTIGGGAPPLDGPDSSLRYADIVAYELSSMCERLMNGKKPPPPTSVDGGSSPPSCRGQVAASGGANDAADTTSAEEDDPQQRQLRQEAIDEALVRDAVFAATSAHPHSGCLSVPVVPFRGKRHLPYAVARLTAVRFSSQDGGAAGDPGSVVRWGFDAPPLASLIGSMRSADDYRRQVAGVLPFYAPAAAANPGGVDPSAAAAGSPAVTPLPLQALTSLHPAPRVDVSFDQPQLLPLVPVFLTATLAEAAHLAAGTLVRWAQRQEELPPDGAQVDANDYPKMIRALLVTIGKSAASGGSSSGSYGPMSSGDVEPPSFGSRSPPTVAPSAAGSPPPTRPQATAADAGIGDAVRVDGGHHAVLTLRGRRVRYLSSAMHPDLPFF